MGQSHKPAPVCEKSAAWGDVYGKFYNGYAVLDSRNLAPQGGMFPAMRNGRSWRNGGQPVPCRGRGMGHYRAGGGSDAGGNLKAISNHWTGNVGATDESDSRPFREEHENLVTDGSLMKLLMPFLGINGRWINWTLGEVTCMRLHNGRNVRAVNNAYGGSVRWRWRIECAQNLNIKWIRVNSSFNRHKHRQTRLPFNGLNWHPVLFDNERISKVLCGTLRFFSGNSAKLISNCYARVPQRRHRGPQREFSLYFNFDTPYKWLMLVCIMPAN